MVCPPERLVFERLTVPPDGVPYNACPYLNSVLDDPSESIRCQVQGKNTEIYEIVILHKMISNSWVVDLFALYPYQTCKKIAYIYVSNIINRGVSFISELPFQFSHCIWSSYWHISGSSRSAYSANPATCPYLPLLAQKGGSRFCFPNLSK